METWHVRESNNNELSSCPFNDPTVSNQRGGGGGPSAVSSPPPFFLPVRPKALPLGLSRPAGPGQAGETFDAEAIFKMALEPMERRRWRRRRRGIGCFPSPSRSLRNVKASTASAIFHPSIPYTVNHALPNLLFGMEINP